MPSHKHRLKKIRQDEKRQARNKQVKSKIKTITKKVKSAAESGEQNIDSLVSNAASAIDSAATKGVIHKRAAARRVSRLAKLKNKIAKAD